MSDKPKKIKLLTAELIGQTQTGYTQTYRCTGTDENGDVWTWERVIGGGSYAFVLGNDSGWQRVEAQS